MYVYVYIYPPINPHCEPHEACREQIRNRQRARVDEADDNQLGHELEPEGDVNVGLWAQNGVHFALKNKGAVASFICIHIHIYR